MFSLTIFGYPSGAIFFFYLLLILTSYGKNCACVSMYGNELSLTHRNAFFFISFLFHFVFLSHVWKMTAERLVPASKQLYVLPSPKWFLCLSVHLPLSVLSGSPNPFFPLLATCLPKQRLTSCGVKGGGA